MSEKYGRYKNQSEKYEISIRNSGEIERYHICKKIQEDGKNLSAAYKRLMTQYNNTFSITHDS